ncbi:sigma-70 family RNA polymerase sigma factor [uncultured Bacteroides sp.]|mgnify:FL=1|uniref:RNA polymerase sigma factor n=1 Tax=uncultured Bacteroides sp. TaxID=162156 RepID=UPI0025EE59B7|nr:sigma-70 family RNA polymerase sigma factor [uncultured Bacteroides sp.]
MKVQANAADEMLVALYSQGNNEAFDILLNRYKDRLYTYIYYTVRNEELAEDIFQETFTKAIITIQQGRYNENGKFPAWLTRIAHNLIIDCFRQEKQENLVSCDEEERNLLNNIRLSEGTVETEIVNHQILADVRRLMKHLPEEQREVVHMRFYQDLSFKEIAEMTGVSINTSLGRMRYAILNLRRMAEKHGIVLTTD